MQYPLISEYVAAIREAKDNLAELAYLVPVLDDHGEPYRSSGAFAVVFKMKDEQTGKCYALKCFTEEQEGRAEAYRQIAEELEFVDSPYITSVRYLDKELFVNSNCEDEKFPVLLMDWVEGETMEAYIAIHHADTYAMSMLCYRFCKLAAWLRSQPFAHGDIKPDNIMVRPDGTLALIDYDGMFVPAMKGCKSPNIGTKDFSHPLRTIDDFDESIDDFALASIALSLKAISLNPTLYDEYGASGRLLFSANDYLDLSKSKVMTALQCLLNDEDMKTLMSLFLLTSAKKNLSMCSFRAFSMHKPDVEKMLSTEVTEVDLKNAVEDEYGVKYSRDGKKLLKAPHYLKSEYVIKGGVKVIGNNAFEWCEYITDISIPNSVTNIGRDSFAWCRFLLSINIPNSVVNIGNDAFFRCESLVNVNIPNSVINIGDNAFSGCYSLVNINVSKRVSRIGDNAFSDCYSLENINIPDSVISIGDSAFYGCKSLTNINIRGNVTSFGDNAFCWCESLANINIPNSVIKIGNYAFCGCKSLININIPDSVISIGDSAFSRCEYIENINIPNSVIELQGNPICDWNGCLHNDSKSFIFEDNILFNKDKTKLIAYRAKETCYIIPNSVTSIGDSAFCGCESLVSISIPNSVINIGDRAFAGCKSLLSINIPNSVISIGDYSFNGCESLVYINIPDSVTRVGIFAFQYCI